ncbi:hypothetical protein FA13DRAFT_1745360 [Coprinellus micaceus]|uniref:Uncharacterized protein n=1 Tax=Coprinellus micaceus TaxID=71717 RepID=A0A4Y7SBI0_COPMI|nr:hypothetical protein FA13DRAFT_1745360 [Coprinellus micaceus]
MSAHHLAILLVSRCRPPASLSSSISSSGIAHLECTAYAWVLTENIQRYIHTVAVEGFPTALAGRLTAQGLQILLTQPPASLLSIVPASTLSPKAGPYLNWSSVSTATNSGDKASQKILFLFGQTRRWGRPSPLIIVGSPEAKRAVPRLEAGRPTMGCNLI